MDIYKCHLYKSKLKYNVFLTSFLDITHSGDLFVGTYVHTVAVLCWIDLDGSRRQELREVFGLSSPCNRLFSLKSEERTA